MCGHIQWFSSVFSARANIINTPVAVNSRADSNLHDKLKQNKNVFIETNTVNGVKINSL